MWGLKAKTHLQPLEESPPSSPFRPLPLNLGETYGLPTVEKSPLGPPLLHPLPSRYPGGETYGLPTVEKSVMRTELARDIGKGDVMRGLSPTRRMRIAA